jgi:hypothetical protein
MPWVVLKIWERISGMSSRSYRNNNPGNIVFGPFAKKYGGVLEDDIAPRFAKFNTASKGLLALVALLSGPSYINLTIEQAISRYAPISENDTKDYITYVCNFSNLPPTATLSWLNAFQFLDLVKGIIRREGYKE